ncbi:anthranilate phosphoribosyltransferase [Methanosphaera sp. WGK6]|uniref:anthranilate phosphoribosyltransferase n=1 Tax=Methanosphaera sp. WGK6 TaxID=1561964 RepID=UPI00084C2BA9|nr:anthranilate phosphoribosyltransferase [Methanosphaera sp. WGK6]OED30514.1 anthranilate phosphoribosyltransferase [Methanosphaera sp. WGK6]
MISDVLDNIIDKRQNLTDEEAYECMDDIISGDYPDVVIASFLIALRMKGETIDEITGLTRSMKDHAIPIDYDPGEYLIETCGTGGDVFKTFNVSTASSIIASAGGAKISKHGNRSVSSKFGGADALEALGINIELTPEQVANSIDKCNFAFIFAPIYHQATKNVMMLRKQLKTRTVFNLLGPISCPSKVTARLTGIYDPDLVETIAKVASNLGVERGMIVHGFDQDGNPAMDEISNIGKTKVAFINHGNIEVKYITPEDFGLEFCNPEDIMAPDSPEEHLEIIYKILDNVTETSKDKARMDLCLMNSASILYLTEKVDSLKEGVKLSRKLIEDGTAKKQLEKIIKYSNE